MLQVQKKLPVEIKYIKRYLKTTILENNREEEKEREYLGMLGC